jgi:hypothetical protein
VPGGSTIAGVYSAYGSSDGLIRWGIKESQEGRDPFAVRDEAGKFGRCIHLHFECAVKNEPFPVQDFPPSYVEIAEVSTARLMEYAQKNGLKPLHSELQLVSDVHHFGGTIDLTWAVEGQQGVVLSDLKGSARVSINHCIQVFGGYRIAFEEKMPQFPIIGRELLRIDRDTGELEDHHYSEKDAAVAGEMFLSCLSLYENAKLLQKALR